MRKLLMLATVLAAVVLPTASHAQFTIGGRLGYGIATGDAMTDFGMDDYVGSQIPLQLDLMYRITPAIAVGGYVSYGFAQPSGLGSDTCDLPGRDCSVSNLRLGVQGTYAFTEASPSFVPWLGVGFGWENSAFDSGSGAADTSGWEYLNLQGGANWKVSPAFSVGPYAMFSIGEYSTVEGNDIPDTAMHQWLSFGVMGKFDL